MNLDLPEDSFVLADKGYASEKNRTILKDKGYTDGIMDKAARNKPLTPSRSLSTNSSALYGIKWNEA